MDKVDSLNPEEFLATLIHEFRNPIMIAKGWVGILSDEKNKELHPKAIEGISQAIGKLEEAYEGMADTTVDLQKNPDSWNVFFTLLNRFVLIT